MEPINFEQHSREKFEERNLQPSASAWGKLEQMLDEAQPEKKKFSFPWFAIAASFVGIVLIATFFYNKTNVKQNSFVEQDVSTEILKTETPILENKTNENGEIANLAEFENEAGDNTLGKTTSTKVLQTQKKKKKEATLATNSRKNESVSNNQVVVTNTKKGVAKTNLNGQNTMIENKNSIVAAVTTSETKNQLFKISEENTKKINTNDILQLDEQVDVLIAQVREMKNTKAEVTEADIDALLLIAQQKLQLNKILSNTKVDAMALLGDAEMELNKSIRDKIFYALEEGFDYVKTTIVTRND